MLIKILRNEELLDPIPMVYKGRLPETFYYNLIHGDKEGWEYRLSVDSRITKVKEGVTYKLDKNYYVLRPITKNGKPLLDNKGNAYQVISRDFDTAHKNNMLLLWELPPEYNDAKYHIKGFANEIGLGYHGKVPAPVLEIYGDCTLTCIGEMNNKVIKEVIDIKLDTLKLSRRRYD